MSGGGRAVSICARARVSERERGREREEGEREREGGGTLLIVMHRTTCPLLKKTGESAAMLCRGSSGAVAVGSSSLPPHAVPRNYQLERRCGFTATTMSDIASAC